VARASAGKLEVTIDLQGVNKLGGKVGQAEKSLESLGLKGRKAGRELDLVSRSMNGLSSKLGSFVPGGRDVLEQLKGMKERGGLAAGGFTKLAGGVTAAVSALLAMRGASEEAAFLDQKLKNVSGTVSAGQNEFAKLQLATKGAFSLEQLVKARSQVEAFNLPLKVTPELMSSLQSRSVAMGITTEHALESLIIGLSRGSAKILDNLAILVQISDVEKEHAAAIGKTVEQLTEQEKKQALVNEATRQLTAGGQDLGRGFGSTTNEFQRITALLEDMGNDLGGMLIPLFRMLRPIVEGVGMAVKVAANFIRTAFEIAAIPVGAILEAFNGIVLVVGNYLNPIISLASTIFGDFAANTMGIVRQAFDAVIEKILKLWEALGEAEKMWRGWGSEMLVNLGILTDERIKSMELAKLESQKTEQLERQQTTLIEIQNIRAGSADLLRSSGNVINQTEANLLKMVKSTRDLTTEEEGRLRFLEGILKTEQATAKIKSEAVKLTATQTELINTQLALMSSGEAFTASGAQKWLALEGEINSVTNRIEYLAHLEVKTADKIRETMAAGKKKPKATTTPTRTPAEEEKKVTIDAVALAQQDIKLLKMEGEIEKMQTLDEFKKLDLDTTIKLLEVEDLHLQGKTAEAELLERRIRLEQSMTLEKLQAAEASAKLAEQEAKLERGINATANATQRAEGKTKALGLSAVAAGKLTQNLTKKEQSWQKSLIATSGPLSAAAQAFAESEANKAKIAGAMELAFAAASFAVPDPIGAAGHLAAAALFFKVASQAGAASSAAPRAPSARMPSQQGQGQRQVIINFNGISTDPQGTARQISQVLASQRGTGA
jgi:hypothetical protein